MDTSETYIKMSHLAFPEPETLPEPPCHKVQNHIYVDTKGQWWADWQAWFIPLYRQDQLQEMIQEADVNHLLWRVYRYCNPIDSNPHYMFKGRKVFATMEQLWFAFVMFELYQKIWRGEDWVKEH